MRTIMERRLRRNAIPLGLLALLASCATTTRSAVQDAAPPAAAKHSAINVLLAARSFDEKDWAPVEDQPAFGVEYVGELTGTRFAWDVGVDFSYDEADVILPGPMSATLSAGFVSGYVGTRFYFTPLDSDVRPYLGAALTALNVEIEGSSTFGSASRSDSTFGVQLRAGVDAQISDSLRLALEWRSLVGAEIEISGVEADADYGQLGVVLGFTF